MNCGNDSHFGFDEYIGMRELGSIRAGRNELQTASDTFKTSVKVQEHCNIGHEKPHNNDSRCLNNSDI